MSQVSSKSSSKNAVHSPLSLAWFRQQSRHYSFLVAKAFCVVCNPYFWLKPVVLSEATTIALLAKGKSIGRFGDGEIALIMGCDLYFQRYSDQLATELVQILNSADERFLVAIPTIYGDMKKSLNKRVIDMMLWNRFEKYSKIVLPKSKVFASAFITRPILKNTIIPKRYFAEFRSIWSGKTIVYVHHDRSEIQHTLFTNAKKRIMIVCPKKHAYESIDTLMKACMAAPKNAIYLLAAGPTATVLAHRLTIAGRQAIDLGHLTLEYDAHLRGVSPKDISKYK